MEESEDVPPVYTDTSETNASDGHKHEQDLFRQSLFTETYERFRCKDARASFNFRKILISPSHLFLSGRSIFVLVY